jgi:hypothetical protein
VDSDTKQPVKVSVKFPDTKFQQQFLRTRSGQKATPASIEMNGAGLCRVTWIDLADNLAPVVLSAEGYSQWEVPKELIEKYESSHAQSGILGPKVVEMKRYK